MAEIKDGPWSENLKCSKCGKDMGMATLDVREAGKSEAYAVVQSAYCTNCIVDYKTCAQVGLLLRRGKMTQ